MTSENHARERLQFFCHGIVAMDLVVCFVFSIKRISRRLLDRDVTDRRNHGIRENGMIVISNPIGGALPAEPAKQTGPDVV